MTITAHESERTAIMRRLRASGYSLQFIADRTGVSKQRVHQILGGDGENARSRARVARLERIRELAKAGVDDRLIAAEVGLTIEHTSRLRRSLGLGPRGRQR